MSIATVSLLQEETGQVSIDVAYGLSQDEIERGRYNVGEESQERWWNQESLLLYHAYSEPMFLNGLAPMETRMSLRLLYVFQFHSLSVVGTLSVDVPYVGAPPTGYRKIGNNCRCNDSAVCCCASEQEANRNNLLMRMNG